ncbi:hypothetical protein FLM48_05540 [Shewanella sp. Scap07]|uniref:hypothetical protein n=1 Tax=Shewanella sp. Scap07 TaxID=2589987 RepID=UPI0015BA26A5|nr:hypothetical protein [Shewanella sp. Scap07]QLE84601.1 hypothetical protein FLM48_05540 [Shewanella sp. Scap07]
MTKTTLTISFVALLSGSVLAASPEQAQEQAQLNQQMSQLQTIAEEDVLIEVDFDASFERVSYSGMIVDKFAEIYISREHAVEMQLQQKSKFHVYEQADLTQLESKIAERIIQDKPRYFSVDLYRDYHGYAGEFTYVAKVIEYQ